MTRAYENEYVDRNAPNPGIAAVLSVLMPGLGQVAIGHVGIVFLETRLETGAHRLEDEGTGLIDDRVGRRRPS